MTIDTPSPASAPAPPSTRRQRLARYFRKEMVPLAAIIVSLLAFRSSLADWYDVPTGSMRPTIIEGDRILVNKLAYDLRMPFVGWRLASWEDPDRGEIVILYSPKTGERLVKRVVGLPGDSIQFNDNVLYVNGTAAPHSPVGASALEGVPASERNGRIFRAETLPGTPSRTHALTITPDRASPRSFGPVQVPIGMYLVLGDNRDESGDSRYFGFVPRELIYGRASRVALSLDPNNWYVPRLGRTGRLLDRAAP